MKEIELTKGKVVLVSDEDYEYLSQFTWYAMEKKGRFYVSRQEFIEDENGEKKLKRIYMHREVAERSGIDTSQFIDHKDRNGLNNQRDNLRPATNKQNQENASLNVTNTSGYRGVTWSKQRQRWVAHLKYNGKTISLGRFKNKEDAARAREEGEKKYYTHSEVCS